MRMTLVEIVQDILSSMDSDEVNSITDTTEALDVAKIVRECYYEIIAELDPKEMKGLFHLDASTDPSKPVLMTLPSTVTYIDFLKYNIGPDLIDTNFRELEYLCLEDFFQHTNGLDPNADWVDSQTVNLNGQDFNFKFRNDQSPHYWTSIDDRTILFDAFDASYETTLTSTRTYGYGGVVPTFILEDTYIPKLDARQFPLLYNAAKSQAYVDKKQTQNPKSELKERRHRILMQKTKDATDPRKPVQKHKGYGR